MKKPLSFMILLSVFIFIFTSVLCVNAQTSNDGKIETIQSEKIENESHTKNDESEDTSGTGNSTGEIIFMLVIFLGSLLILAEAIVSTIKKNHRKKENVEASMDERRR